MGRNSGCLFSGSGYNSTGMLLGGLSVLTSLAVVLLMIAAAFVANILAGMIALLMLNKKQH